MFFLDQAKNCSPNYKAVRMDHWWLLSCSSLLPSPYIHGVVVVVVEVVGFAFRDCEQKWKESMSMPLTLQVLCSPVWKCEKYKTKIVVANLFLWRSQKQNFWMIIIALKHAQFSGLPSKIGSCIFLCRENLE